jgi:cell wall-associated NlpC family hydrolase
MMNEEKRAWIVRRACEMLGTPYKVGAKYWEAPSVVNCSVLTWFLYREIDIELKGKAIMQARRGEEVPPRIELFRLGDLIFIKSTRGYYDEHFPDGIGHVGIYIGNGKVISARKKQGMVVEEDIAIYLNPKEFRIIKRVI